MGKIGNKKKMEKAQANPFSDSHKLNTYHLLIIYPQFFLVFERASIPYLSYLLFTDLQNVIFSATLPFFNFYGQNLIFPEKKCEENPSNHTPEGL